MVSQMSVPSSSRQKISYQSVIDEGLKNGTCLFSHRLPICSLSMSSPLWGQRGMVCIFGNRFQQKYVQQYVCGDACVLKISILDDKTVSYFSIILYCYCVYGDKEINSILIICFISSNIYVSLNSISFEVSQEERVYDK